MTIAPACTDAQLIAAEDGALLAVRGTTADGALLEDAVVVRQAITDHLPG